MSGLQEFAIPSYPAKFLKTKLGRKCLFYSIVPYLCKYDTTHKTFKKIQLFCCIKKETLISEKIRKKYDFDDNSLALEKILINQSEKYRKSSYIKEALFEEYRIIKKIKSENKKIISSGESKIKSLVVDNGLYFYHLYLIAKSLRQQAEETNECAIERALCRKETTEKSYCMTGVTRKYNSSSLEKIFERKGIKKLIPLLYGIYTILLHKKENIKGFKRKTKRAGNKNDYIIYREMIKDNLDDLFTKNTSKDCDVIYANRQFLIKHIDDIIEKTNELASLLEKYASHKSSDTYWKFGDEISKSLKK